MSGWSNMPWASSSRVRLLYALASDSGTVLAVNGNLPSAIAASAKSSGRVRWSANDMLSEISTSTTTLLGKVSFLAVADTGSYRTSTIAAKINTRIAPSRMRFHKLSVFSNQSRNAEKNRMPTMHRNSTHIGQGCRKYVRSRASFANTNITNALCSFSNSIRRWLSLREPQRQDSFQHQNRDCRVQQFTP